MLLFRREGLIVDSASIGQGIMHREFLLELFDVLFILFEKKFGIQINIDRDFITDLHHPRGKFES